MGHSQPEPYTSSSSTEILGVSIATCYVDDFERAYDFYANVLGLVKQFDMGADACYFRFSDSHTGLYLQGGNTPTATTADSVRASFILAVPSAHDLYAKLAAAGVPCVHDAPQDMGGGAYWFQFYDPAGNILEALQQQSS